MPKKTILEIAGEAAKLRELKPRVLRRSRFGDDHHDAIDAQIEVLEKNLSNDKIYDRFEPTGDSDVDGDEGRADNVLDAARDARSWMDGESEDASLTDNWQSLVH